jgi:hypothetical protein
MTKKLLGLAAFLIGVSAIIPWAVMSGGMSYTSVFEKQSTSSNGYLFPWITIGQTSVTRSEHHWYRGWESGSGVVTVSEIFPFQIVVTLCWLIGFIFVLVGFKDRRVAFVGGLMCMVSVGYFLSVLPSLNRSGSVIHWFVMGSASVKVEPSIGCIPIALGAIIAILLGLQGFVTKDRRERRIANGQPDVNTTIPGTYTHT